jgi:CelD/BcsL family acetyltransferase involved in cellulose biosynthesis
VGAQPVDITVVRSLGEIEGLRDVWDDVGGALRTPMQHHAWVAACAEAFAHLYEPRIVVVGPLEAPRAIAPLGLRRGALELLGARELMEPMDFLYRDESAAEELTRGLRSLRRPLRLSWLLESSPVSQAIVRADPVAVRRHGAAVPTIELDGTDPEQRLSSRKRQDLRRARRRAESDGAVTVEVHAPSPAELEPLLAEALAIEAASWKGEAGTALAEDGLRLPFYRRYAERAAADGTLRIALLRIGGRAVAMQYASESENRYWLFKIGYDAAFAKASPGQLLLLETLRHAAEKGLASYEFLGSEAEWTRQWTTDARPWCSIRAYPPTVATLPVLGLDVLRTLKGAVRR